MPISVKIRQKLGSYKSGHLRIGLFLYMLETSMKENHQKMFFQKIFLVLILWTCKVTSSNNQIWKYVLKANFEIIFWEKPWPAHRYLTITWKYFKRNVPKKSFSHVIVKASLKAIPQNQIKKEKNINFEDVYLSMPLHPHRFFGCNCKYSGLSSWATFHFYVAPQASSRNWVGMWQKIVF